MSWPRNDEPFTKVGFYAAATQKQGGAGYVCIGWGKPSARMAEVAGPFRNQSEAMAYGRKHFPRRYKVAGIHAPLEES